MKKNQLKEIEKNKYPIIFNEWVPSSPIIYCNGCGNNFIDKNNNRSGGEIVGAAVRKIL